MIENVQFISKALVSLLLILSKRDLLGCFANFVDFSVLQKNQLFPRSLVSEYLTFIGCRKSVFTNDLTGKRDSLSGVTCFMNLSS